MTTHLSRLIGVLAFAISLSGASAAAVAQTAPDGPGSAVAKPVLVASGLEPASLSTADNSVIQSETQAACSLIVPPIKNNVCEQEDDAMPGYGVLSCENPRNHDQTTFCAAVYGYERNWCARISNPALRQECWNRTE